MKNSLFTLILIPCLFFSCREEQVEDYKIIPYPNNIVYYEGSRLFSDEIHVYVSDDLENEYNLLERYLQEDFKASIQKTDKEKEADLIIKLLEDIIPFKEGGYELEVKEENITIISDSKPGILHGIQTLRQIMNKTEKGITVQNSEINDFPAFEWRAFMLDEARHFKGKDVVKDLLDEMSLLKMNVLHWHLTDDQGWRIEIKKYPKLTKIGAFRDSTEINHFHSNIYDGKPHGGFYTQDEIKEVLDHAAKLHILVVPEIEMPGHATAAIASYPELGLTGIPISVTGQFGVHYDIFNVTDQRVLNFISDVFDEIIELFPSPIIHIGGDEIKYEQWNNSYKVKYYMKQHGLETPVDLQVYFTNNISNMLKSKGKRMMGWNDIIGTKFHHYQFEVDTKNITQKLTDETIVQFWKGDTTLIINTAMKGYDIVNSFHEYTYLNYSYKSIPLDKAYSFNPIPNELPTSLKYKILGLGCQMWGEFIPDVEDMQKKVFPRIAAYAEVGWTLPANKNFNTFRESLDYYLDRWQKKGILYGDFE